MSVGQDLPLIDMLVLTILAIAIGRGLWIGLIREGLSLVSIAMATVVTRLAAEPLAQQLTSWSGGDVAGKTAVWIAGVILVVVTILTVGATSRFLRRGAQFAGLGWADRLGGGALGAAEGAVVSAIVIVIALWLVGSSHPAVEGARSVALVEQLQTMQEKGELPAVAAPGDWR